MAKKERYSGTSPHVDSPLERNGCEERSEVRVFVVYAYFVSPLVFVK